MSSVVTPRNMRPVMASTNRERSFNSWAGVECGAKIEVGSSVAVASPAVAYAAIARHAAVRMRRQREILEFNRVRMLVFAVEVVVGKNLTMLVARGAVAHSVGRKFVNWCGAAVGGAHFARVRPSLHHLNCPITALPLVP